MSVTSITTVGSITSVPVVEPSEPAQPPPRRRSTSVVQVFFPHSIDNYFIRLIHCCILLQFYSLLTPFFDISFYFLFLCPFFVLT